MKPVRGGRASMPASFRRVVAAASPLPGVVLETRYDGSPVLRLAGCFMAAPATHPSAERDSLVIRASSDERALWIEEAPEIYYLTDYYRRYPLVLVRLAMVEPPALRDLLALSWRLTVGKTRGGRWSRRTVGPSASLAGYEPGAVGKRRP